MLLHILTDIDVTKIAIDNISIDIDVIPCFNDYVSKAKRIAVRKNWRGNGDSARFALQVDLRARRP